MEKLLQLLNEYRLEKGASEYTKYISETWYFTHKLYFYEHYSWVISKKFWFIQWLVENDKIILQKDIIRRVEYSNYGVMEDIHYYSAYESILMYLAIQDDPISFLSSILK